MSDRRIVLIGEAPGPSIDLETYSPLFPAPVRSSGYFLWKYSGLEFREDYLKAFQRCNVFQFNPGRDTDRGREKDLFPMREARIAAGAMLPFLANRTVIFVGRRPATAFGHDKHEFFTWGVHREGGRYTREHLGINMKFSVIPHTSGRSHFYNIPENRERLRVFLQAALAENKSCLLSDGGVEMSHPDR